MRAFARRAAQILCVSCMKNYCDPKIGVCHACLTGK